MKSSAAATRAWMSAWSSPSHWMHWPSFAAVQGIHADGVTADVGQEPAGAKVQVPAKYRQLFLETMLQDVGTLSDALKQGQADKVVYAVHRMSGALVDVGHVVLAQRLQT